jgi:hypothetical protein
MGKAKETVRRILRQQGGCGIYFEFIFALLLFPVCLISTTCLCRSVPSAFISTLLF